MGITLSGVADTKKSKEGLMKDSERLRLSALKSYGILDTESEKIFDDLTKLCAEVFESNIALISFVDENRQWFKSKFGLDLCETNRDIAFCDHAIRQDGVFIIEDTHLDDRFRHNPLVTGTPHIRFYAGAILKTHEGHNIGTLCVAHTEPKKVTKVQEQTLKNFADLVMSHIELKKKSSELDEEKKKTRYRLEILNALPDFAGTCDLNGTILTSNNAFDEISRREGVTHIFDYYPNWAKKIQSEIAVPYAIEHGIWRGESAVLKKNGEELHIFQTVICHRDFNGYPEFFSTVMQDMSQIKAATNRFETLTTLAPVGIFMTNENGAPTFFNDQWFKVSGMTREQALADNGFGSFAALHPDDLERVISNWFEATKTKTSFTEEFRIKNFINGKVHYIRCLARALKNPQDEVTGYIGINQDLTEERAMAAKLTSSVKQLETFITNIPAAVAMFDKNINYIAVSKRWIQDYGLNKFGLNENNIIGKSHYDVFPGLKQEWKDIHQNALQGVSRKKDDDQFLRDDGTTEWLNWDVRPWFDEKNDIGGIMMLTEVTTNKKLADIEIRRAQAIAEKASEAKSLFLANVSHEMRTPLNSIIGLSDLISQTPLESENARHIKVIQKSGEVLKTLIDDIIDLSTIESGKIVLQKLPVNFSELAEKLTQIFQIEAQAKNIDLSYHVEKDLPLFEGDPVKISQIMIKLLGNAIKYTHKGSVILEVKKNILPERKGNILVSIKDTGIGIDGGKQRMIFEKFTQAENTNAKKYGGTGLGLAITKSLVELMDGLIWVQSELNVGSEFLFTLNLAPLLKTSQSTGLVDSQLETFEKKLRILVVDDSIENRALILAYLKKYPFLVETAENGREALNLMKNIPYDFVFMDIQMPVMDGLTATKEYREWERAHSSGHVPIAALTAFALQEDLTKSLSAGCDMHLTKPVKKLTILEAIKGLTKSV